MGKTVVMIVLLVAGLFCMMRAKMKFQERQMKTPDNVWAPEEKRLRRIAYGMLAIALGLASIPAV